MGKGPPTPRSAGAPVRTDDRGLSNAGRRSAAIDRILDESIHLFLKQGYKATSIQQIASAAGYTKGAVYFYFESKEGLLSKLLDRVQVLVVEPTAAAVEAAAGDAKGEMVAFLHSQAGVGRANADYMLLAILISIELEGDDVTVEGRVRGLMERLNEILCGIIERGQTEGVFRTDAVSHELASLVMAVNTGCFIEWRRRRDATPGEDFVRIMRKAVLDGIGVQE